MNRRELLKGLMAGGTIIAGELWVPGQTFISIPSGKQFYGPSLFEMVGKDIKYIGPAHETVTVRQFYNWLLHISDNQAMDGVSSNESIVSLSHGYRIDNPEHLVEGALHQDRIKQSHIVSFDREYWGSDFDLSADDLVVDKVYQPDFYIQVTDGTNYVSTPAERISESDLGTKGWR